MKIPFMFWYENYDVLSITKCITVQEFCMNADKIVIRPVPYISLRVSESILGRTAEMERLCAHFTHHFIRRPLSYNISFYGGGAFFFTGK